MLGDLLPRLPARALVCVSGGGKAAPSARRTRYQTPRCSETAQFVDSVSRGIIILNWIGCCVVKYFKKFNESNIKLSISDKDESEAKEEE